MTFSNKEIEGIIEENELLKKKIKENEINLASKAESGLKIGKKIFNLFIGRGLRVALLKFSDELPNNVKRETVIDVIVALVWRITRIGVFAVLVGLIPIILLSQQNRLLKNQNSLIEIQSNLLESDRRSSLVFLMNNIFDKMDEELKNPENTEQKLSNLLVSRIISLSESLRPYKYYQNDKLIETPLSPERTLLLNTLIQAELDSSSYLKIFRYANFSFSDYENAQIQGDYSYRYGPTAEEQYDTPKSHLGMDHHGAKLDNSNFKFSTIDYGYFVDAYFSSSNFSNSYIDDSYFDGAIMDNTVFLNSTALYSEFNYAKFYNSNFTNSTFRGCSFEDAEMDSILCQDVKFIDCNLFGISLEGAKFKNIDLSGSRVSPQLWNTTLSQIDEIKNKFTIGETVKGEFGRDEFVIVKKNKGQE